MEPVAKAERYVVVIEVDDDDNDDDAQGDDNCDRINNHHPPARINRLWLATNHQASLGFSLCNVGGRKEATRNTAQCKHTICSLQNRFGVSFEGGQRGGLLLLQVVMSFTSRRVELGHGTDCCCPPNCTKPSDF